MIQEEITKEMALEAHSAYREISEKYYLASDWQIPGTEHPRALLVSLEKDIAIIFYNAGFEGLLDAEKEIKEIFMKYPEGENILKIVSLDRAKLDAAVRLDWEGSLKSVKKGTTLSPMISWSFSDRDISSLAKLHKRNRFRRKIEDLLEDCNFHAECGDFVEGNYEKYMDKDLYVGEE